MKKFGVYWPNLLIGIIAVVIGIFLIAADETTLATWTFRVIGILMIVINISPLIQAEKVHRWYEFVYRLILVLLGVAFIFCMNTILCIITGLLFIVCPCIMIVLSENRKEEIKYQLPSIIMGIVILVLSPCKVIKVLYVILGIVIVACGAIIVLSSFYTQREIDNE